MGPRGGDDAARSASVLHRLSEGGGAVRRLRGGLSIAIRKPERAEEAGRPGHGDACDAGRGQAVRACGGGAGGRGAAGVARHDEGRERGCCPARVQDDRRKGRRRLASRSSGVLRGAAARRTVDPRRRHDDQAPLRPSGRGGSRLQSQETGTAEPLLSHLFDGLDAAGFRRRRQSGRPSIRRSTARPAYGRSSTVFRATCGRRCCAATAASATRASCARRRRGNFPISSSCV